MPLTPHLSPPPPGTTVNDWTAWAAPCPDPVTLHLGPAVPELAAALSVTGPRAPRRLADLTWVSMPCPPRTLPELLAEALRRTRPGGVVVAADLERPGTSPLHHAEALADCLALVGLHEVATRIALHLVPTAVGDADPCARVSDALTCLGGARLMRLQAVVAARGVVPPGPVDGR